MFSVGTNPPEDTSMRSTPFVLSMLQSSIVSSISQPPGAQSVAESLTRIGRLSGH